MNIYFINNASCTSQLSYKIWSTVKKQVRKFRETGSNNDLKQSGRYSTQNIKTVRESIDESLGRLIARQAQELNISKRIRKSTRHC